MTVYTDAAGISYIGDVQYGNWSIQIPSNDYPLTRTATGMNADMTTLLTNITSSGGSFSDVASDATFENPGTNVTLFRWTPAGDTTADATTKRFRFYYPNRLAIQHFADNGGSEHGFSPGGSSYSFANHLLSASFPYVPAQYVVSASPTFIFFGVMFTNNGATVLGYSFASRIPDGDINTNFSYYNSDEVSRAVYAGGGFSNSTTGGLIYHNILSTPKICLRTGDGDYSISCSDGQTPGDQWATDTWVFDDNATLGYPAIGKVPGMISGTGVYVHCRPVKLQGTAKPNNGHNSWLPVSSFAGKTILMPCYTSAI